MLLQRSGAVLMWRPAWHAVDDRFERVIITVLVMLASLTIVSLPLARRIANPIDKLVNAAQRLRPRRPSPRAPASPGVTTSAI